MDTNDLQLLQDSMSAGERLHRLFKDGVAHVERLKSLTVFEGEINSRIDAAKALEEKAKEALASVETNIQLGTDKAHQLISDAQDHADKLVSEALLKSQEIISQAELANAESVLNTKFDDLRSEIESAKTSLEGVLNEKIAAAGELKELEDTIAAHKASLADFLK